MNKQKVKKITEPKMKQLVVMIAMEQFTWLKESARNQHSKLAPFLRTILAYLQETASKEIYTKMAESRLKVEVEAAQKAVEEATKLKEQKEHELAELVS